VRNANASLVLRMFRRLVVNGRKWPLPGCKHHKLAGESVATNNNSRIGMKVLNASALVFAKNPASWKLEK